MRPSAACGLAAAESVLFGVREKWPLISQRWSVLEAGLVPGRLHLWGGSAAAVSSDGEALCLWTDAGELEQGRPGNLPPVAPRENEK